MRKPDKRDYKTKNPRLETRTNCEARLGLKNVDGKLMVHDFVEDHNHELLLPETTHMLSSQRKVSEIHCQQIELANSVGVQQKKSFDLLSKEVGGRTNLGFIRLDQKNYLRKKRERSLVQGEAGYLLQYFQRKTVENPTFYHAYQLDIEDQITNVFWADARMLVDYSYFGDVVSLDSTYCTNSSHRPLAIISGFNHHRGAVIFGAALLYDETAESYEWLFETFLEAHKQKMPQTDFTDQAKSMAKALAEVMPEAYHGLCTWHLMQNGIKHLGNLMKGESYFLSDFKKCMYGYEDVEQFEDGWTSLLIKYDVQKNDWLQRMYNIKEKWASCYMKKTLTLGMRSTQLSESVNADIKNFMSKNLDLIKFFERFEDVVEEKRYKELKCEFEARQKIPRLKNSYSDILQQVSKLYTPTIFDLFQREYELFEACFVKSMDIQTSSSTYVIAKKRNMGEWQVTFDLEKNTICCSCRKFESFGILCCHCLKVFIHMEVTSVPEPYILKRWTKIARSRASQTIGVSHVVEDLDLSPAQCYKEICPRFIRIVTEGCRSPEAVEFLKEVADELDEQMLKFQNMQISSEQVNGTSNNIKEISITNDCATQVKGFKNNEGPKGSKRWKGWVETKLAKRKKRAKSIASQIQEPMKNKGKQGSKNIKRRDEVSNISAPQSQKQYVVSNTSDLQCQQPFASSITSAPIWLNNAYNQPSMGDDGTSSQFGVASFTSLLMEQLDDGTRDLN